ncbi:hypothetical protein GB928_009190 [Shinella curvata]|uniref:Uncharacterized protein n=1 Tax=Shinella curvata TaxID=1817964 RepID=A0ABT8XCH1_9HYPH|nr:hypothetical protein [Shinella curvata]MCJ8054331.1 hypothetical protein [Shinella curvata]MDO6121352.1 hypothetical protein [Shinella curvata]
MRRIMLVSAIAALSFCTLSASALAGMMPDATGIRSPGAVEFVTHYYGHKPKCFWKKIKKYDYYGNLVIKKVKVCH